MEWNLAMNAKSEPYTFQVALEKFMLNFYHDSTLPLNDNTISLYEEEYRTYHRKNPELIRMITEMEENEYRTKNASDPERITFRKTNKLRFIHVLLRLMLLTH